jgi:hypothetical protein
VQQRTYTLNTDMFGLFKKKSEKEILQNKYEKLMKEAHTLSTTNRKQSDNKVFEAEEVLKKWKHL